MTQPKVTQPKPSAIPDRLLKWAPLIAVGVAIIAQWSVIEYRLGSVFHHVENAKEIHQTEAEKTLLMNSSLEPIKLQIQRLEIIQESHGDLLKDIKHAVEN